MNSLRAGIGIVVVALVTGMAADANAARVAPTFENVSYGPHERNVLDFWRAKSERPTPVVVFIHGGGFLQGDKANIRGHDTIKQCLDAGVSFASINYRFRDTVPIQTILRDAARAIQFLRSRAKEWNLDPARIASYGSSAGAGTSLWLAFHDDLADPASDDPVLRESSRLAAAGSLDGQASYDLRDWATILGETGYVRPVEERLQFYGFASPAEADTPEADRTMKDCSMFNLITKDDPPVVLGCSLPGGDPQNRGAYVHHPKHSIAIADRCRANGIDASLLLHDESKPEREQSDDDRRAERGRQEKAVVDFLIKKLGAKP